MMLMGLLSMPHEKLHVLFRLILMTQYFTSVTTSISLLSQSSGKSTLSPSLSGSASASSTSKSLPLSSSFNPSSPNLPWPMPMSSANRQHEQQAQRHHHNSKLVHSELVPYSSSSYQGESYPGRLSLILEKDPEVPTIKRSHLSRHQKRHSGNETINPNNSGDLNNNNRGNQMMAGGSNGVTTFVPTSFSPSIASTNGTIIANSSLPSYSHSSKAISSDLEKRRDSSSVPKCRYQSLYFPQSVFDLHSCAGCYNYLLNETTHFGKPSKKLKVNITKVQDPDTGEFYHIHCLQHNGTKVIANVSDVESPIWETFVSEEAKKDWTGCCQAAKECCQRMVFSWKPTEEPEIVAKSENTSLPLPLECPPTWDGWQCWNSTKPGVFAQSYCPNYVYFLTQPPTCSIPLPKECTVNGTWALHKNSNKEWTDYSVCTSSTVRIHSNRSYVLVIAYAISVVGLVPAVIIFFSFGQLRVPRIILHQNLFFSFILNGLMVIIFKTSVIMSETNSHSIVKQNSIACRLLLLSTKYLRMTNYMWMLCEGYYLHKLIAAAFAEQRSLLVFYLLGWGFPLLPTAVYTGFRILYADEGCWVTPHGELEWVLNGPSLLSLLINTLFLVNIIRVLVTKLRAAHSQEPSQYRKAVRATLVLLPLFGLHFVVTIYRPSSSLGVCQSWTQLYFYANDVLDGMQGFFVALIFCYCNGEVISLLKRSYMRWKEDHFNVGTRANSRHRPSRGSVLGRSVVSTHIYSSIPPSPETNIIALPGGSNPGSQDPSPSSQSAAANLLAVNGASETIASNVKAANTASPILKKSDSRSSLKNRKNHTSSTTNGNAINMYVSSEYGSVKENPGNGVEMSCV